MKNLVDFIKESEETKKTLKNEEPTVEVPAEKVTTFDFTDVEGADDFIKEIEKYEDFVNVEDKHVTITAKKDSLDDFQEVYDKLSDFIKEVRKGTKNAADEQYAQKTHALLNDCEAIGKYLEDAKNPSKDTE